MKSRELSGRDAFGTIFWGFAWIPLYYLFAKLFRMCVEASRGS